MAWLLLTPAGPVEAKAEVDRGESVHRTDSGVPRHTGHAAGRPAAQGEGPRKDRRTRARDVEERLRRAGADLAESSERLERSTAALRRAEADLRVVRHRLAEVRGRLVAARVDDERAAARLAQAVAAVRRAEARLAAAQRRVDDQRRVIGEFAREAYRQRAPGDVIIVLGSRGPRQLLDRMHLVSRVTARQAAELDRWYVLRAEEALRRAELAARRDEAERHRRAAAKKLERVRALERRIEQIERRRERAVADRSAARKAAERARAEDRRRYADLVAERRRIQRILRELAGAEARQARAARRDGPSPSESRPATSPEQQDPPGLLRPVQAPVSSSYGRRFHPILRVWRFHDGTDYAAPCGTPVRAAASGRVFAVDAHAAYGNRVLVAHGRLAGASTVTTYDHLSRTAVAEGERVERGEIVGYVGDTGYSTGCHLHAMVLRDGSPVDPETWW